MISMIAFVVLLFAALPNAGVSALAYHPNGDVATTPCTSQSLPAENCATLRVPSVAIETNITRFPVQGGTWAISPWETEVGHFEYTDWFGAGHTLVGGHSMMAGERPGVFVNLDDVAVGDEVIVTLGPDEVRYIVTETFVTNSSDVSVIAQHHRNRLTLITCDIPSLNAQTGLYDERRVVVAVRAG